MGKNFTDDPQRQDYAKQEKAYDPGTAGGKQIAHENLPHRMAKSQIVGGDIINRANQNYAKNAPSLDGENQIGRTFLAMARD